MNTAWLYEISYKQGPQACFSENQMYFTTFVNIRVWAGSEVARVSYALTAFMKASGDKRAVNNFLRKIRQFGFKWKL